MIVSDEGVILAETRYTPGGPGACGATYVTSVVAAEHATVTGREVGMACGSLTRATGRDVLHVKYSQVCQGAGQFIRAADPGAAGSAPVVAGRPLDEWLAEAGVTRYQVRAWTAPVTSVTSLVLASGWRATLGPTDVTWAEAAADDSQQPHQLPDGTTTTMVEWVTGHPADHWPLDQIAGRGLWMVAWGSPDDGAGPAIEYDGLGAMLAALAVGHP